MKYQEKLKDPRWQRKRLEVLKYAQFRCQICGDKTKTLHVHHSRYVKGKAPWQYPLCSLLCVCETHHAMIHKRDKPPEKPAEEPSTMTHEEILQSFAECRKRLQEK